MNDSFTDAVRPRVMKAQPPIQSYTQATLLGSPAPQFHIPSQFIESDESKSTSISNRWDGSEASEHAHIWHIYNDESSKIDTALIDGCNRGIDVLLVFTGLFSAVLTTFIIQSYQQMIPSPSDTTNALLLQMINDFRRSPLSNISDTPVILPSQLDVSPSLKQIHWVNGLWFAALSFSLSAALVSMLAKQWIQPLPNISGSPRYRARLRQRWHAQLETWHVFFVINALPVLLHIALLLFFAGVIVLLWSGDIAIVGATFTIVALAYTFYVGSMWMSLINPDCPYQHPISEQLRRWVTRRNRLSKYVDIEKTTDESVRPIRRAATDSATPSANDCVDAMCLVWLLQQSTNDDTTRRALQAIGGLPRDFSAFHVLREANAIQLVLQQFASCFQRDVSFATQWHVLDPDSASMYCRSWIRLTHGTSNIWPRNLRAPLYALRDGAESLHVNAVAACACALDSLDSHGAQLAILSHIRRLAEKESSYDEVTQGWLLETFLESSLSWELRVVVLNDIVGKAVPILLRLLQGATDGPGSKQRRVIVAAILHSLAVKNADVPSVLDEEKRNRSFNQLMIPPLAAIIHDPGRFGVDDELLDFTVSEFSRVATPTFGRVVKFPSNIKVIARQGLSKLYLEGRVGVGLVPDNVLVDILQIIYPPVNITEDQRPLFVKSLVKTLANTSDVNVAIWAIRLLEPILTDCHHSVLRCFTEENGVRALLDASRIGDADELRLQMECIRTICTFIHSTKGYHGLPLSPVLLERGSLCPSHLSAIEKQIDHLCLSEFLSTLASVIGARRWWLKEVADVWVPSLLHLCQKRPQEKMWRNVEKVFRHFVDTNEGEEGSKRMLEDLDKMAEILNRAQV